MATGRPMKSSQSPAPADAAPASPTHPSEDVHTPSVLGFAAGVVALIGVCIVASIAVLRFTTGRTDGAEEQAEITASPLGAPPVPGTRLQISPQVALQAFAHDKAAVLHSYAWVDRRAGRVRIPIAQAIELVAQRGLPVLTSPLPVESLGKEQ